MKKITFALGIVTVFLVVIVAVFGRDLFTSQATFSFQEAMEMERAPIEKVGIHTNRLILQILQEASVGKVPNVSITAGESDWKEIVKEWGEPTETICTGDGIFVDYPEKRVSFGHKDSTIFEVRSFSPEITFITFEQIMELVGEPKEQRYYKDAEVDQLILVYQVNETYKLKFVLSRPTNTNANPNVHHINVYSDPAKHLPSTKRLLESMTLEEKIGQMIIAGIDGTTPTPETKKLIKDYHVGGIIFFSDNLTSYKQSLALINVLKQLNSVNEIPLFLSVDQEGGRVTRLPGLEEHPSNKEIGLQDDPRLSYQYGSILAKELLAFGMNVNFAPVVDVNNNPKNPVIGDRAFGNNVPLVSRLSIPMMKGMKDNQIIPVIKHFPGHGDTEVDSHLELPRIDKTMQELQQVELVPFKEAIAEGAEVVMVAHILFPQLDSQYPSSMSKPIITDLLREKLGFNGVIITDDMMMDAIENHYEIGEAAVQSVKAGSDILLISEHYEDIVRAIDAVKGAVENGEISEKRIDESVERIIRLKEKYDINDNQVQYQDLQDINQLIKKIEE
ncbi:beta-N-acetylhexosaminidase [Ornithinibacillus scapharcae]|uniref:beta-N-acetylhexosaminidase n=1 Tax=Ornithinibacillus scapharcae TaxID=1147159 RepID=UPI000225C0D7|nr:beta-N-acetylhexosaminidase [Ornithinibacillus scapharcae]